MFLFLDCTSLWPWSSCTPCKVSSPSTQNHCCCVLIEWKQKHYGDYRVFAHVCRSNKMTKILAIRLLHWADKIGIKSFNSARSYFFRRLLSEVTFPKLLLPWIWVCHSIFIFHRKVEWKICGNSSSELIYFALTDVMTFNGRTLQQFSVKPHIL